MMKKFRKLAYICIPQHGLDELDVDYELDLTYDVKTLVAFCNKNDRIPLAPFEALYSADYDSKETHLADLMVLMGKCDEVWVLTDVVTPSMKEVIDRAKLRHKTILYFKTSLDKDQLYEEVGGLEE